MTMHVTATTILWSTADEARSICSVWTRLQYPHPLVLPGHNVHWCPRYEKMCWSGLGQLRALFCDECDLYNVSWVKSMVSIGFYSISSYSFSLIALIDDEYWQAASKTHGTIPSDSPETNENGEAFDSPYWVRVSLSCILCEFLLPSARPYLMQWETGNPMHSDVFLSWITDSLEYCQCSMSTSNGKFLFSLHLFFICIWIFVQTWKRLILLSETFSVPT
jgi:hypothetical protein